MSANAERGTRHRMRIRVGKQEFTILRHWTEGFSVRSEDAPHVRGLVDVYDGARHVSQCLIVATGEDAGEMSYEYKRRTPLMDGPPADYERAAGVPVGLIAHRH